jgi:membrane protein implicated in regulation of membrane protease activity
MNQISKQLLSAIDVLTDEKISKLEYDKTIQATITKVEDLDSGEYKVRYSGNIFSVYASDVTTQYAVGDVVYVTVPERNFSNKKVITSTVTA